MKKADWQLGELARIYETYNWSEGKSPRTVEWYNDTLLIFETWLVNDGRPTSLESFNEEVIRAFILYTRNRRYRGHPLKPSTVANRVRALRAFFSWLEREGYVDRHLMASIKQPKVPTIAIEPLSDEEIDRLFAVFDLNIALDVRDAALLSLFLDAGPRLTEGADIKECDVHLDQRYVKFYGKGGKERLVPIGADCQRILLRYSQKYRPEPAYPRIDNFFLTLDGYPIKNTGVSSVMDRIARKSGVRRLHAHLLRHTYATRFLLARGDIFLLKQYLGHSTLVMVEYYRHIAGVQAAILGQDLSPLDRLGLKQLRRRGNRGRKGNQVSQYKEKQGNYGRRGSL
ncbi:MAG: tyrosine-type recombinase/integrase [Chloroflexi bacterium]|nr:tyrosine-type recombinase/integrase [Chloroflexota bacterium]